MPAGLNFVGTASHEGAGWLADQLQSSLGAKAAFWSKLVDTGGSFVVNLAVAALLLIATLSASGWAAKLTTEGLSRLTSRRGLDRTLHVFAASLARYLVLTVGLIAVLQQLGVRTTSILAVLGAASLAVGLALQGALANVAASVLILIFRPFRVGERVVIGGKEGTVRALDLFSTELADPDNVRVIVPNGKAFGDVIINYSRHDNRRVELNFHIDYGDDVDEALGIMIAVARADPRVLMSPEPWAKLTALGDSAVTVTLRAWVKPGDWWDARFDITKGVKDAFTRAGLRFPYPHQVGLTRDEARGIKHAEPQPAARRVRG